MAEFNDKIIEMGCDFWIDTEEDAPSVVTRMTVYNPRGLQQKAKYSEQDHTKKYPESSLNKICGNYPVLPILKKTTI